MAIFNSKLLVYQRVMAVQRKSTDPSHSQDVSHSHFPYKARPASYKWVYSPPMHTIIISTIKHRIHLVVYFNQFSYRLGWHLVLYNLRSPFNIAMDNVSFIDDV